MSLDLHCLQLYAELFFIESDASCLGLKKKIAWDLALDELAVRVL